MANEESAQTVTRSDREDPGPTDGPAPVVAAELPFSEMMSRWLDAGDRLHETVAADEVGVDVTSHAWRAESRARPRRRRVIGGVALVTVIGIVIAFHQAHSARAISAPSPNAPVSATGQTSATNGANGMMTATVALAPSAIENAPAVPAAAPALAPVAAASPPRAAVPRNTHRPETSVAGAAAADGSRAGCRTALLRQRPHDALAACRTVLAGEPSSADAMVLLARADLLSGRQDETLRLARRAVVANPQHSDAYLLIGSVEQIAGHKTEARSAYQSYLKLAPRGAQATEVRTILRTL